MSHDPTPMIRPTPDEAEAAAIMAATEALWPKPVQMPRTESRRRSGWRFSGRWWAVPLPARRDRPWM